MRLGPHLPCTALLVLGLALSTAATEPPKTKEKDITKSFCTSETFDVRCKEGEVILIKAALYGRMHPGRCISDEYAHTMGCYADVTSYLETECSGKDRCQVMVGTLDHVAQPCLKDFKSYLEVTYECAPVSYPARCSPHENALVLSNTTGYISLQPSQEEADSFQQHSSCPWMIRAGPGQKINITALHFARFSSQDEHGEQQSFNNCPLNIIIEEQGQRKKLDVCTLSRREQMVYVSTRNTVQISMDFSHLVFDQIQGNLLLKYQMYGCTDIIPPDGASSTRSGDTTVVRCNETQEVWYITCQRDSWIGSPGNCSAVSATPKKSTETKPTTVTFRYGKGYGILIAVLVGIVLGTFVGGALLFVVYLFRRSKKSSERPDTESMQYETRTRVNDSTCSYPALLCQEKQCGENMSEYTHVWNMRAPTICSEGPYGLHGDRTPKVHTDCLGSKASNLSRASFERINMTQRPGDKCRVGGRDTPMYFELDSTSRPAVQCPAVST